MSLSYYLGWRIFRLIYALYFRWRVYHPDRVPAEGPVILAANHTSYLDPPLVAAGITRQLNILARDSLFTVPVMGSILHSWEAIPVDRSAGAKGLKNILDRLLKGRAILLFPEGGRSPDGNLMPARSGIGLTVIKSKAPVVPTRVFGTHDAYSRHDKIPFPSQVSVKYGKPLHFEKLRAEAKVCSKDRLKEIYQQVSDEIMIAISRIQPGVEVRRFPN